MQKTKEVIIQYIKENGPTSPSELLKVVDVKERALYIQLKNLIENGEIKKTGVVPHVYYSIKNNETNQDTSSKLGKKHKKIIDKEFLYTTPLGEIHDGVNGFTKWCNERGFDINQYVEKFAQQIQDNKELREHGLIKATNKLKTTFNDVFLDGLYYIDFYSMPIFGKTKLGQLLLYSKQSQDKKRIKLISNEIQNSILTIIKKKKIDAVGFIPPTVKREVQFMKELENNLNLNLPKLNLVKLKTEIIVPQKTLSKLSDRIKNAANTIIVDEKRQFKNILLIDDAVGSGATLNETARKIKNKNVGQKVFGLTITGSLKGFDVISEV